MGVQNRRLNMWENFEKLNESTSKTAHFALEIHFFLENLPAYPLKPPNLFNFREGRQKGRGRSFFCGGGGGNRQRYATVWYHIIL